MKLEPQIIYKDPDFLILNKPAGMLTHGIRNPHFAQPSPRLRPASKASRGRRELGIRNDELTVADWLLKNFPEVKNVGDDPKERPGIVHRLDRDTSGVLAVARNQKAFDYLKNLFQTHQVKKTYLALVCGWLKEKEGIIEKPIGILSGSVKRSVHLKAARMIKEAKTKYKVKQELMLQGKFSLVEVEPTTGRTHQIRVHLNSIGHPIVGDKLYGRKNPLNLSRQFLHADSIEFTLPSGSQLKIGVDLPEELSTALH